MFRKFNSILVIASFLCSLLTPVPQAQAQGLLGLPEPGTMVSVSPAYEPAMIKGVVVHTDNPFMFDFIVDEGQEHLTGEKLRKEGEKLIKYFLAGLTIPEKDLWVNLSPYEKDRTIPETLSQTAMGRDLLAEDYLLKQITASLIYPDKDLGKEFWDKVYAKARQLYGTTQVPVNTFNKVWITADRAEVYEHNNTAFVVDCHLKVMLEEDYLALKKHSGPSSSEPRNDIHSIGANIVREIILPQLEKEVNTGRNFAQVRQIFNSIILASWYKNNLKQALLNQVYANKGKVKGIDLQDKTIKEKIYQRYLEAYKKGVFNFIREDTDPGQVATIPRKYFSGGVTIAGVLTHPNITLERSKFDYAMGSRGDFVDIRAVMNGTHVPEALAQQHLGTVFQVFTDYPYPDGEKVPLVRISEIYDSHFSPEIIASIRAQIQKNPAKQVLLLRESVIKQALNGDQEIALTKEMGEIPSNYLYENLIKSIKPGQKATVKLSKKATEILPSFISNYPGASREISSALEFAFRIGGYFRTEIIDPKYGEPLYLLCFNYERLHQRDELVITPVGGGADFNGPVGKELYTKSGLALKPVRVSVLDKKDEFMAMRQIVSLDPNYNGKGSAWEIFWKVYSGGRANPLKEALQELGEKELKLLDNKGLRLWVQGLRLTAPSAQLTYEKLVNKAPEAPRKDSDSAALARSPNGGIDLNTENMKWDISKDGNGVEMAVDPAMIERVKREGIESLTPEIFLITPVVNIWPLVGLQAPQNEDRVEAKLTSNPPA